MLWQFNSLSWLQSWDGDAWAPWTHGLARRKRTRHVETALTVNSYWFPDTYLTIASYMKNKGVEWKNVNPQEILGVNYSSAQGYARIAAEVTQPQQQRGGSSCGVWLLHFQEIRWYVGGRIRTQFYLVYRRKPWNLFSYSPCLASLLSLLSLLTARRITNGYRWLLRQWLESVGW